MWEITYAAKQVKTDTGGMLALTYSIIVDGGEDGPESYGVKIDELNGDTHERPRALGHGAMPRG